MVTPDSSGITCLAGTIMLARRCRRRTIPRLQRLCHQCSDFVALLASWMLNDNTYIWVHRPTWNYVFDFFLPFKPLALIYVDRWIEDSLDSVECPDDGKRSPARETPAPARATPRAGGSIYLVRHQLASYADGQFLVQNCSAYSRHFHRAVRHNNVR